MSKYHLGIDVAKDKFDVALLIEEKFKTKTFNNTTKDFTALLEWLNKHNCSYPELHCCMEATGVYGHELATFLIENRLKVSMVNPARIKSFGKSEMLRTKTDKSDSKLIARFCQAMNPALWAPAPEHIQLLQGLVRRLDSLIAIKLQEENRLAVTNEISIQESINSVIKVVEEQILEVKNKINNCIGNNDDLNKKRELLATIPGVGEATINTVLAFLVGYEQFDSAKQMAAFIGLTPRHHESGKSVKGRTRISKVGDAQVRKSLYFPAIVAKKHNPIIKAFCEKLEKNGKTKMEIICAAMRKLIHIIFGVIKNKKSFDPKMA